MMNGIEAILAQIRDEAQKQAGELAAEAQKQAAAIRAAGDEKAKAEAAAVAAAGKARADAVLERARQDAIIEGRKQLAAEKQKLLDSAFDRALERLLALPEEEYSALLARLVVSACADGEGGELLFSARDRDRVGKSVLKKAEKALSGVQLTLAEDCAPIRSTFSRNEITIPWTVPRKPSIGAALETVARIGRCRSSAATMWTP